MIYKSSALWSVQYYFLCSSALGARRSCAWGVPLPIHPLFYFRESCSCAPSDIPWFVCFLNTPFVWAVWIPCWWRRWNSLYLKFIEYWTSLRNIEPQICGILTSNLWSIEPQIRIYDHKIICSSGHPECLYLSSKGLCSVRQNWPSLSAYGAICWCASLRA